MNKPYFAIACLMGCLAVGVGAFGAHALKNLLQANGHATTFETASQYHFYHALGLGLLALWHKHSPSKRLALAQLLLLLGTAIFSGTLYVLSLTGIKWLGAITPIGGLLLVAGWALAAWQVFSEERRKG